MVTVVADKLKRQWLLLFICYLHKTTREEASKIGTRSCILERGHTCMYQRACHYLASLVPRLSVPDFVSQLWRKIKAVWQNPERRAWEQGYYLAAIVTTEHLWENHHKSIFLKCSCSDSLTDVLRIVSCKVWFWLRLLMQLTSYANSHNHYLLQPG